MGKKPSQKSSSSAVTAASISALQTPLGKDCYQLCSAVETVIAKTAQIKDAILRIEACAAVKAEWSGKLLGMLEDVEDSMDNLHASAENEKSGTSPSSRLGNSWTVAGSKNEEHSTKSIELELAKAQEALAKAKSGGDVYAVAECAEDVKLWRFRLSASQISDCRKALKSALSRLEFHCAQLTAESQKRLTQEVDASLGSVGQVNGLPAELPVSHPGQVKSFSGAPRVDTYPQSDAVWITKELALESPDLASALVACDKFAKQVKSGIPDLKTDEARFSRSSRDPSTLLIRSTKEEILVAAIPLVEAVVRSMTILVREISGGDQNEKVQKLFQPTSLRQDESQRRSIGMSKTLSALSQLRRNSFISVSPESVKVVCFKAEEPELAPKLDEALSRAGMTPVYKQLPSEYARLVSMEMTAHFSSLIPGVEVYLHREGPGEKPVGTTASASSPCLEFFGDHTRDSTKKAIDSLVSDLTSKPTVVAVPSIYLGKLLMDRRSEALMTVSAEHFCHAKFSKEDLEIEIHGLAKDKVQCAKAFQNFFAATRESNGKCVTCCIPLVPSEVGRVIGTKGSVIQRISIESGVVDLSILSLNNSTHLKRYKLEISQLKDFSATDLVVIYGTPACVEHCFQIIEEHLDCRKERIDLKD